LWQVSAMHRRAQIAESRAERAEKALRQLTSIHAWLRKTDKAAPGIVEVHHANGAVTEVQQAEQA
jgi:hypothetical protein